MNGFLTEPIVLSGEQSAAFLNSLRRPNKEYLNRRDEIFAKMDEEISIARNGMDMEVEIPGLDLSFINEMNNEREQELVSDIEISAEYSCEAEYTSLSKKIFKKIMSARLTTVNDIVFDSIDGLNRVVNDSSCMYSGNGIDKLAGYVKDKKDSNMSQADKAGQEQMALAS